MYAKHQRVLMKVVLWVALAVAFAALAAVVIVIVIQRSKRIPRVFMRTGPWEREAIPPPARAAMDAALALNPQYTLQYYSHADVKAYIAARHPQYAALYASIRPGAYRADLWRLLYLYDNGGVYNDMGHTYAVPMSAILDEDDEFVSAVDFIPWAVQNAFLAAYPRHPLIRAMFEHVVANVRARSYGLNPLDITGPWALGRAFNRFFHRGDEFAALPVGTSKLRGFKLRLHTFRSPGGQEQKIIVDSVGAVLIHCKFKGYVQAMYGDRSTPHHTEMYHKSAVYWD
jgi:hypothetical protein